MAYLNVSAVSVAYPVHLSNKQQSAFAAAANVLSFGRLAKDAKGIKHVLALDKVSVEIKEGMRVGLIGRNGSGKSTLLRTVPGIIRPREGVIESKGTFGCLLNLHAGLDYEKSGIGNMRLIARLNGLRGAALSRAVDSAAEFTELGPFLDLPVRTYSSGMTARLSFAIATAQGADIMCIDEVIAAGDAHFVAKAVQRVRDLCSNSGIVLLAVHVPELMRSFCDFALWLDGGKVISFGPVDDVLMQYSSIP